MLQASTSLDILHLANVFTMDEVKIKTLDYIQDNFKSFSCTGSFLQLSLEEMEMFIDRGDELSLFHGINRWIHHDYEERVQHSPELLSGVRFALIPKLADDSMVDVRDADKFPVVSGSARHPAGRLYHLPDSASHQGNAGCADAGWSGGPPDCFRCIPDWWSLYPQLDSQQFPILDHSGDRCPFSARYSSCPD